MISILLVLFSENSTSGSFAGGMVSIKNVKTLSFFLFCSRTMSENQRMTSLIPPTLSVPGGPEGPAGPCYPDIPNTLTMSYPFNYQC